MNKEIEIPIIDEEKIKLDKQYKERRRRKWLIILLCIVLFILFAKEILLPIIQDYVSSHIITDPTYHPSSIEQHFIH